MPKAKQRCDRCGAARTRYTHVTTAGRMRFCRACQQEAKGRIELGLHPIAPDALTKQTEAESRDA